jgi:hypothetical protein
LRTPATVALLPPLIRGTLKQVMEVTGGGTSAATDFAGSSKGDGFSVNIVRKSGKRVAVWLDGGAPRD